MLSVRRTCPSDNAQARALVSLVQTAGWTKVSVFSAATSYAAGLIGPWAVLRACVFVFLVPVSHETVLSL